LINEPTRITETSETLLDPFICGSEISKKSTCQVLPSFCSDHCPILATIQRKAKVSKTKRNVWLFKQANWDLFRADLINRNIAALFNDENSVDQITEKLTDCITIYCNKIQR
jgi:hypothetical protein